MPIEPTQEMHEAGWSQTLLSEDEEMGPDFPVINTAIYRAMLAAAPIPPATGQGDALPTDQDGGGDVS